MSDLFEEEEEILEAPFNPDDKISIDTSESTILDARRRLEKMLEEKRLRDELNDFVDY